MNILLTGGTGFIGSAFRSFYPEHHYTVVTRSSVSESTSSAEGPPSNTVYRSLEWLYCQANLNAFDAVINLVGEPIADRRWTHKVKQRICHSRWDMTERLVALIDQSENPPGVFISGSAVGFYGGQGSTVVDEAFVPAKGSVASEEFSHKVCDQWESLAQQASNKSRVCIVRTGIVLGRAESGGVGGALKKMLPAFILGLGGRLGSGEQYMPWIHLKDEISAIEFLLQNEQASGVYNLTAPEPVTNTVFTQALGGVLSRPVWLNMPEWLLKILFGEMSELLLHGQNAVPARLLASGFTFRYSVLDEALMDICKTKTLEHKGARL